MTTEEKFEFYGRNAVGPIMLPFVKWIITKAEEKNIKRIYFLSRDGYLLFKIARQICQSNGFDIDCRYLYCSRMALRTPTYHFIGDEAFELLTLSGYYATVKSILERASLSENEMKKLAAEIETEDVSAPISHAQLNELCARLKSSPTYKNAVFRHSKDAYETAVEYFKQEGLFEEGKFAIADSGWTGSMQRSLRQLLEKNGFKNKITGFYFGMYASPNEEDGEYNTFYFSKRSGACRKADFNNNLFECMLSAPHPMTCGYKSDTNGAIVPIYASPPSENQLKLIEAQIHGALEYVTAADLSEKKTYPYEKELKKVHKILRKYMVYPSVEFAKTYGSFLFCDDVTEGYQLSLAEKSQIDILKKYMLIPRIMRKLFRKKDTQTKNLLWPYGTVAFCPAILRPWYRFNLRAWDFLKAISK